MKVLTTKGPVEFDALSVRDVVEVCDNTRKVASEFYLGDELVRRDVAVSMLMPIETQAEHGRMG